MGPLLNHQCNLTKLITSKIHQIWCNSPINKRTSTKIATTNKLSKMMMMTKTTGLCYKLVLMLCVDSRVEKINKSNSANILNRASKKKIPHKNKKKKMMKSKIKTENKFYHLDQEEDSSTTSRIIGLI